MIEIKGPWKKGFSFDKHTIKNVCIGNNEWGYPVFETTRSDMGEYVYNLKYKQNIIFLDKIIEI